MLTPIIPGLILVIQFTNLHILLRAHLIVGRLKNNFKKLKLILIFDNFFC